MNKENNNSGQFKQQLASFGVALGKVFAGVATAKDWVTVLKLALPILLGGAIFAFSLFTVLIALILGPIEYVQQMVDNAGEATASFFEKFGNWFSGNGWSDNKTAFDNIIEETRGTYGCKYSSMITATVMYYYQIDSSATVDWGDASNIETEETVTNEDETTTTTEINYGKLLPDLKRLSKKIKSGDNKYEEYVKNTFLEREPYNKLLEGFNDKDKRKEEIYEEIKAIAEAIPCATRNIALGGVCSYNVNGLDISDLQVRLLECNSPNNPVENEELIDFETYITGVVYQEVGDSSLEVMKAQAIVARSYALTRNQVMGGNIGKIEQINGQWVISLRACTYDMSYCHPDKGCWSNAPGGEGNLAADATIHTGYDESKPYPKQPIPTTSDIRRAVQETAGMVAFDSSGNIVYPSFDTNVHNQWKEYANSGMDYQDIIKTFYPSVASINADCVASGSGQIRLPLDNISLDLPCDGSNNKCTSDYSLARPHPVLGYTRAHYGIDFGKPLGTPIYTIAPGVVVEDGFQASGAGLYLTIGHDVDSDGTYDYYSRYFHMSEKDASLNQSVAGGQVIGKVGNTGVGTGHHLHFELKDSLGINFNPRQMLIDIANGNSVFNQMIMVENVPYYNVAQVDSNHPYCGTNTIQTSGCWPASFAMIVSGLKEKSVLPSTVADFICANKKIKNADASDGGGTDSSINTNSLILQHFGVTSDDIGTSEETIKKALLNGKPVILNVPGHYVVISKYVNGKYTLLDSGEYENNGEYSTLQEIVNKLGRGNPTGAWAFGR